MSGENIINIIEKVKQKTQERLELNRKLKMTTAQMRLQALVILLSPVCLCFIIFFISPDYILFFINNYIGLTLLLLMVIFYILACYFLHKFLRII